MSRGRPVRWGKVKIRHWPPRRATSGREEGYSMKREVFADDSTRQESVMSVHHGRGQQTPSILTTPKSFLAAMLSLACLFSLGIDVPSFAAMPAEAKDKKTKHDSAVKN